MPHFDVHDDSQRRFFKLCQRSDPEGKKLKSGYYNSIHVDCMQCMVPASLDSITRLLHLRSYLNSWKPFVICFMTLHRDVKSYCSNQMHRFSFEILLYSVVRKRRRQKSTWNVTTSERMDQGCGQQNSRCCHWCSNCFEEPFNRILQWLKNLWKNLIFLKLVSTSSFLFQVICPNFSKSYHPLSLFLK